ncbi:leucine dehydrogenase [Bacillus shivajii]|uniref:Leu/Phe/Val dehydrogenase n=1 Tax=Bacillus shivajii TaxID=1983719 RepID=UPI001CFBCAF9|nr:Glu/Leu/Phe/Val dehydrogenase [Bacillus shivajii]UCZ54473.1 leucine dehydrogenase [Bacillus shivajii]
MSLLESTIGLQQGLITQFSECEQVIFCNDQETGLKAIIAIHDTTLGPAIGGCRMLPYSSMTDALQDVLRLSKGMTYKCAAADVDFGGGKAVIIGDPEKDKSPEMFRAFGKFVESLNGRFYTGTDMGTTMEDFVQAYKETNCIVGIPKMYGGSGDSSVPTAEGVIFALKATNRALFGEECLVGKTYAIQGLGKVGYKVANHLLEEGADLFVTDVNKKVLQEFKRKAEEFSSVVKVVEMDEIYRVNSDIFVPCAVGGIINETTVEQLTVRAIVGSANNQLQHEGLSVTLNNKGILYAPDYIVNSGGLIQVSDELYGANKDRVLAKTKAIYYSLLEVFNTAEQNKVTTVEAANQMCEKRMKDRAKQNSFFLHNSRPKWDIRR